MTTQTATLATPAPRAPRIVTRGRRIAYGAPLYCEVMDFLIREALLLDEGKEQEWANLLDRDIFYYMSQRRTLDRGQERFDEGSYWYYENWPSLDLRIRKFRDARSYFAEDPPSRIRRFVSNLTLFETDRPDEYAAVSYVMLARNRGDQPEYALLSCMREDLLRRRADGWSIGQRHIMVDQAVLGMPNISFFL